MSNQPENFQSKDFMLILYAFTAICLWMFVR
jgi:hypothetical protein